jgi:hypothetical protein
MKKVLIILALAVVLVWPLSTFAAGPFLVTNPQAGVDYFVVNGLPTAINATNCAPDPAGTYGLKLDLSALVPGSYTVTAQACSNIWGCSTNSSPFGFTRPDLSKAPAGVGLSIK